MHMLYVVQLFCLYKRNDNKWPELGIHGFKLLFKQYNMSESGSGYCYNCGSVAGSKQKAEFKRKHLSWYVSVVQ